MACSWNENAWTEREDERDRLRESGQHDLDDHHVRHQATLDERDRRAEIASLPFYGVHVEQPSERERQLHRRQEREARLSLYPQRGATPDVQPLGRVA